MGLLKVIEIRIDKTSQAVRLANDLRSKIKMAFAANWLALTGRFGLPGVINLDVTLIHQGQIFRYRFSDMSGLDALIDIFIDGEYDVDLPSPPDVIFDIGSNVGASLAFFKLKYPHARLFGFEPDPNAYHYLQKNAQQFLDANVQNIAVSDKGGETHFYSFPHYSASSSLSRRSPRQHETVVAVATLDQLMKQLAIARIDLLKFDVEGAEVGLFKEFKHLQSVGRIVGELHLDLIDITKEEFFDMFSGFDIRTHQVDRLRYIVDMINLRY